MTSFNYQIPSFCLKQDLHSTTPGMGLGGKGCYDYNYSHRNSFSSQQNNQETTNDGMGREWKDMTLKEGNDDRYANCVGPTHTITRVVDFNYIWTTQ